MSASLSLPWCLRSRFDEISLDSSKPMSSPHCPNLDVHTPRIAFASAIQRQFLVYGPSNSCSLRLLHGSWLSIWDCHRTWCRSVRGSWFPSLSSQGLSNPEQATAVAKVRPPRVRRQEGEFKEDKKKESQKCEQRTQEYGVLWLHSSPRYAFQPGHVAMGLDSLRSSWIVVASTLHRSRRW